MEKLIKDFQRRFTYLEKEDFEQLLVLARMEQLQKGEFFSKAGDYSHKIGIIQEGLVRGYLVDYEGREITTMFREESKVIGAYDTLFLDRPTNHYIQAMENVNFLSLSMLDIRKIENPRIQRCVLNITEEILVLTIKRTESLTLLSPLERYLNFVKNRGALINRIPQKYLASYLGVTPQSFSRLKRRIK
ncbi:MAG: Crp/Fnr family transcriptional regulator [Bacteroidota bacterium]